MATSTSIINTIFVSALFLGAAVPVSADPVFPPRHLSSSAVFGAGSASEGEIGDAWYHESQSDQRVSLKGNETQTSSPYPSTYYFAKIRVFPPSHVSDESSELVVNRGSQSDGEIRIAGEQRVSDAKS